MKTPTEKRIELLKSIRNDVSNYYCAGGVYVTNIEMERLHLLDEILGELSSILFGKKGRMK